MTNLETLGDGTFAFYSTDRVESPLVTDTIDLGFAFIYECKSADAAKVRALFNRIDGESIRLENYGGNTNRILKSLRARAVTASDFGTYAYTPKIKAFITMTKSSGAGNAHINLQIVQNQDVTIVGWPVILGSY
jgi:hypothetical protein